MPQYKKKKKPGSGPKVALQEINKVLKSILNYICGRSCEGRMRLISRCCHWALGSHFHKYRKEKQSGSSIQQQLICNAAGLSGWGGVIGAPTSRLFQLILQQIRGLQRMLQQQRTTVPQYLFDIKHSERWNSSHPTLLTRKAIGTSKHLARNPLNDV